MRDREKCYSIKNGRKKELRELKGVILTGLFTSRQPVKSEANDARKCFSSTYQNVESY